MACSEHWRRSWIKWFLASLTATLKISQAGDKLSWKWITTSSAVSRLQYMTKVTDKLLHKFYIVERNCEKSHWKGGHNNCRKRFGQTKVLHAWNRQSNWSFSLTVKNTSLAHPLSRWLSTVGHDLLTIHGMKQEEGAQNIRAQRLANQYNIKWKLLTTVDTGAVFAKNSLPQSKLVQLNETYHGSTTLGFDVCILDETYWTGLAEIGLG